MAVKIGKDGKLHKVIKPKYFEGTAVIFCGSVWYVKEVRKDGTYIIRDQKGVAEINSVEEKELSPLND